MKDDITWFSENDACRGCEYIEDCREAKAPRRTSCWIRFCRDKYWNKQLEAKK